MVTAPEPSSSELDRVKQALLDCWRGQAAQSRDVTLSQWLTDVRPWLPAELAQVPSHVLQAAVAGLVQDLGSMAFMDSPLSEETDRPAPALPTLPGYAQWSLLGRGGMGVVYKAWQEEPGRWVAVKMLPPEAALSQERRHRFAQEPRTLARLQHPNIVPIYETGSYQGQPYFTMEYVPGGTLARHLQGRSQPPRLAAKLVGDLAQATAHAHAHGVLHRDLKPGNVLLHMSKEGCRIQKEGKNAASFDLGHSQFGIPKITDFGLAKLQDSDFTATGMVLGTPSYMAPEQARGETQRIGPAADVYALGAILYEMLTGRPPFLATNSLQALLLVQDREQEPTTVSALRPDVPPDLAAVCMKCLAKEPTDRYATAADLAADLERFLAGRPVLARPLSRPARTYRWCRRHPRDAALAALLVLVLLTAVAVSTWFGWQERQARRALEAEDYFHRIGRAALLWEGGDLAAMEPLLDGCPEAQRHWEWHYLHRLCHPQQTRWQLPGTLVAHYRQFNTSGTRLAVTDEQGRLSLWETASGCQVAVWPDSIAPVYVSAFTPDDQFLVLSDFQTLSLWEVETQRRRWAVPARETYLLAVTADGATLLACSQDRRLRVYELASGRLLREFPPHVHRFNVLGVHPTEPWVAAGDDGGLSVWNWRTGALLRSSHVAEERRITCVRFSPDGKLLAAGLSVHEPRMVEDGRLLLWDLASGKQQLLVGHGSRVVDLCFTRDRTLLASCSKDKTLRLWDIATGQQVQLLHGPHPFAAVQIHADGQHLLTFDNGGQTSTWDLNLGQGPRTLRFQKGELPHAVAFAPHPTDRRLASAHYDKLVRVWDADTGRLLQTLTGAAHYVRAVAWSPKGRWVAAGDFIGNVCLWEAATGQLHWRGQHPGNGPVDAVAFSGDGTVLATAGDDHPWERAVLLWEAATGRHLDTLAGFGGKVHCLAFHPKEPRLAIGGRDGLLYWWDTARRQPLPLWLDQSGRIVPSVTAVAFTPRGDRLALVRGVPSELVVWDVAARQVLLQRSLQEASADGLAFTPDGQRLVSICRNKVIQLWSLPEGREVLRLPTYGVAPTSVAFNGDGTLLAVAGWDRCLRVWNGTPRNKP